MENATMIIPTVDGLMINNSLCESNTTNQSAACAPRTEEHQEFAEVFAVVRFIHLTASPVILVVGVICNILALLVLMRKNMTLPIYSYFKVLSVTDTLTLITNQTFWLVYFASYGKIVLTDYIDCNVVNAFRLIPPFISVNLLVAISFERTLMLYFPKNVRETKRKWLFIGIVIMISVLENWHMLGALRNDPNLHGAFSCVGATSELEMYHRFYDTYIVGVIYSYFPLCSILIFSVLIVIKMIHTARKIAPNAKSNSLPLTSSVVSTKKITVYPSGSQKCPDGQSDFKNNTTSFTAQPTEAKAGPSTLEVPGKFASKLNKKRDRVSLTVILLCLVYFILTSPQIIARDIPMTPANFAQAFLARQVLSLLFYVHHAINLLVYCVVGQHFRQEFVAVISCGKCTCKCRNF